LEERIREEAVAARNHKILLDNRKKGSITGVADVISFDPGQIILKTSLGMLEIKGQDLKVTRLSVEKGEVDLAGRVDSMVYSEMSGYNRKAEGFITRMFK
jgi:sporulation protein YabP